MSSAQGEPAEAPSSAQSGKGLLIVAASVLALGGVGFVAYPKLRAKPEAAAPVKKSVVYDPGVLELEPFVLNLADPAGDRFFRLNLRLVLDQRALAARAAEGLGPVKLRDRILAVLAKRRATELTSVDGKEALRAEIRELAGRLLAEKPYYDEKNDAAPARILDVLFAEFLVQ
jgi:flagellar FliL protein